MEGPDKRQPGGLRSEHSRVGEEEYDTKKEAGHGEHPYREGMPRSYSVTDMTELGDRGPWRGGLLLEKEGAVWVGEDSGGECLGQMSALRRRSAGGWTAVPGLCAGAGCGCWVWEQEGSQKATVLC